MTEFYLNNQRVYTNEPSGMVLLDFIRNNKQLKGAKLVCKEGECGACTVLVGSIDSDDKLCYQSMTSCIMPIANAQGKHIVTIEGLNMNELSPIQQSIVDEYGTQCGFCTPGFVVSLSGYLLSTNQPTQEGIIASIDGNICRCTGYKSIERATEDILKKLTNLENNRLETLAKAGFIPEYFTRIKANIQQIDIKRTTPVTSSKKIGGGTDLYVQRPFELYESDKVALYDNELLNRIDIQNGYLNIGAAVTMGDLSRSKDFALAVPNSSPIFKLLSSTQIRNMATIGGNLVNASPIGDFSIILLALDSTLTLNLDNKRREVPLKDFFKQYKKTDLKEDEIIEKIRFKILDNKSIFHFEKVSQRKYFDIATVNLASKITIDNNVIMETQLSIGGVGPIPIFLQKTANYLRGKTITTQNVNIALDHLQSEISPISDARGSAEYKRLLARQLLLAQFLNINATFYQLEKLIHV